MNRSALVMILLTVGLAAAEPASPPNPRLLVCGWGLGYLAVYDGQGREEWRIGTTGQQTSTRDDNYPE